MDMQKRIQFLEKTEPWLMLLAVVSVAGYLGELRGIWANHHEVYTAIMMVVDLCFLLDLTLKIAWRGRAYLMSPWFMIDFLSSVPAVGTVLYIHGLIRPFGRFVAFDFFGA